MPPYRLSLFGRCGRMKTYKWPGRYFGFMFISGTISSKNDLWQYVELIVQKVITDAPNLFSPGSEKYKTAQRLHLFEKITAPQPHVWWCRTQKNLSAILKHIGYYQISELRKRTDALRLWKQRMRFSSNQFKQSGIICWAATRALLHNNSRRAFEKCVSLILCQGDE